MQNIDTKRNLVFAYIMHICGWL